MKRFIILCSLTALLFNVSGCSQNDVASASGEPSEIIAVRSPDEVVNDWETALLYLKEGNQRFISEQPIPRDTNAADREITKDGQFPFATIVTCADSRVSPEIYLDQKLGDIFVIRNAGNIADETTLGSIEFAAAHLQTPLVVVIGHSECGAVAGALAGGTYTDNLQTIIDTISVSVRGRDNLKSATFANVDSVADLIRENQVVKDMGTVVIGAYYDIETGEIIWFD